MIQPGIGSKSQEFKYIDPTVAIIYSMRHFTTWNGSKLTSSSIHIEFKDIVPRDIIGYKILIKTFTNSLNFISKECKKNLCQRSGASTCILHNVLHNFSLNNLYLTFFTSSLAMTSPHPLEQSVGNFWHSEVCFWEHKTKYINQIHYKSRLQSWFTLNDYDNCRTYIQWMLINKELFSKLKFLT